MTTLHPTMLTPTQAATLLNVSRSHVYRMIQRNQIPVAWLGGVPRIPRQQLIDQIAEQAGPRRAA